MPRTTRRGSAKQVPAWARVPAEDARDGRGRTDVGHRPVPGRVLSRGAAGHAADRPGVCGHRPPSARRRWPPVWCPVGTVLTPLLVLQIFAASSGFNLALRRGHYDLVLARGVPAPGLLAAHWVASIAPGIAIWLIVAVLEPLVSSAPPAALTSGSVRGAGAGVEPAVGAHHAAAALRGGDRLADAAGHVAGGRPVRSGRPRDGTARHRGRACWARWRWWPTRWS